MHEFTKDVVKVSDLSTCVDGSDLSEPLPIDKLISFSSSDEFCDSYPHHIHPTPGYWVECSRAISNRGSAWTNALEADCGDDLDLAEVDEGITNSPDDGSLRDPASECDEQSNLPR